MTLSLWWTQPAANRNISHSTCDTRFGSEMSFSLAEWPFRGTAKFPLGSLDIEP